ncbi:MAG: LLM class flavin-dependent oxidoreductase [Thermoleophilaceae bacterium]|nr:LLM class flavin-dependent oxidoreductase [Thermoleophilaceae bacterium]
MAYRELTFGLSLVPLADEYDSIVAAARAADRAELDLIGIQDHPYQSRFLDTWSLIADLLARTQLISFFPDVANLPLRPPAVMAKAAASLDLMSGGRFELGLGSGGFPHAVAAMGGPSRSAGEAVDALSEAIDVILLMWSGERSVGYEGRHYRLRGLHPGPQPAHDIGIWLGAYKPRMLALTGERADGWVPSLFRGVTPEGLGRAGRAIDAAARAAGRHPAHIRRVWNVPGLIADADGDDPLHGTPARMAEALASWAREYHVDTFVFWPEEGDAAAQAERFAREVAPAVREAAGA